MGKFSNGVLGTMTGKVGGIVGRTWKGINTVASYQPNVANPRTNAQVAQRAKLTVLTKLASQLNSGFIKPLWDRFSKKMSGFNAFIQANMQAVDAEGKITFYSLVASRGKMDAPHGVGANIDLNEINLTWSPVVTDQFGLPTDEVLAFAIGQESGEVFLQTTAAQRSLGALTIGVPLTGEDAFYIYLAFRRKDGTIVSNSADAFAER